MMNCIRRRGASLPSELLRFTLINDRNSTKLSRLEAE